MANYVDLIPFLKQQYEEGNNELEESFELNEDKIPPQLLKAYKRNWESRSNQSADILSKYGDAEQWPNHGIFTSMNSGSDYRRQFPWDFGKAYYKKLSKQQAVDLLQMKIYSGSGRNKQELSINDPIPEDLSVKFEGDAAKQNINKLRFLVNDNGDWKLTEFEYRGFDSTGKEVDQFFPIYREYINPDKFTSLGINPKDGDHWGNMRINDIRGWKTPKAIYYMIKVSDLIFETDEYDHPLDLKDDLNSKILTQTGILNEKIHVLLQASVFVKYLKQLQKRYDYTDDTILEIINKSCDYYAYTTFYKIFKYFFDNDISLTPNSSYDDFKTVYEQFIPDWGTINSYYTTASNLQICIEDIINSLPDDGKKWFVATLKKTMSGEMSNVVNFDTTDWIEPIQDEILDGITDERIKQIWTRRVHNDRLKTSRKLNPNDHINRDAANYKPYDRYKANRRSVKVPEINDTGSHSKSISNKAEFDNQSDKDLYKSYIQKLNELPKIKKRYIVALNLLNQIKNETTYFGDDDEYAQELESAKFNYTNAKADYLGGTTTDGEVKNGVLKDIQLLKDKLKLSYDREAIKHDKLVRDKLSYLQTQYNKLLNLRNLTEVISAYTEDQIRNIYGFENKEEFDILQSKLNTVIKGQEEKIKKIKDSEEKIRQLQEQIASLMSGIDATKGELNKDTEEISKLNDEKEKLSGGIEKAIIQSYNDQAEFGEMAEKLNSDIEEYKANLTGKHLKDKVVKPSETDERFLKLIKEFSNTPKRSTAVDDKPDDDDIMTDDEIVNVKPEDQPQVNAVN